MQSRVIDRLARKLRKFYKVHKSWRKAALICHVLNNDGKTNPRLALRIAKEKFEPGPDIFSRLARDGAFGKLIAKPRIYSDLSKMLKNMQGFLLENRESFQ